MIPVMKKLILALTASALLTACSSEPARTPPPKLDYSTLGKIYLNTQDLRVINRAENGRQPPSAVTSQRPTVSEAVARWVQDRLQATGATGHATLIIKEASVVEKSIPMETGVGSWFTRQQATKYLGRVEVDIEAQSPVNNTTGNATAHAVQAITLPENPNEAEKEKAYRELLDSLMNDLNKKLDQAIRDHMAPFLGQSSPNASSSPNAARSQSLQELQDQLGGGDQPAPNTNAQRPTLQPYE
jgi:hypothetical protein